MNNIVPATVYRYPFQSLTFQGITVQNPDVAITVQDRPDASAPKFLIGIGVLRQLHMYISYKDQMLYVTQAEAR